MACFPILLSAAAADASAASKVRFLHALPGGPAATLDVGPASGGEPTKSDPAGFAEATAYGPVPSGRVTLSLIAGGKRVTSQSVTLRDGARYTVVAGKGTKDPAQLRLYPDGAAKPGGARVRAVHGAPELERADFRLGRRPIGQLDEGAASDYAAADPGSYSVAAFAPGGSDPIVERRGVNLAAGTASTAYLIGSGGERARFVVLEDGAAAPTGAPATGLGGLSDGDSPWLLALLAALGAGGLGGAAYLLGTARSGRARI